MDTSRLILFFVTFLAFVFVYLLLLKLWPRKGKWGINSARVNCPRCGAKMPLIRKPRNRRQALWGGGTCDTCGCEMDKYGVEIPPDDDGGA
jgi:hypothetical protein